MFNKYIYHVICFVSMMISFSCNSKMNKEKEIEDLILRWEGRKIQFPKDLVFSIFGVDTIVSNYFDSDYKVVIYADNLGCISCKLKLSAWKKMISEFNEISDYKISFLFYLYPNYKEEIIDILKQNNFNHPVCLDLDNTFYKLNNLPFDEKFHVFLLNKKDNVLLIGNPVNNSKIRDLYMDIILGNKRVNSKDINNTSFQANKTHIDLGKFYYDNMSQSEFVLINTGNNPLVVIDVSTSCGCTSVEYNKEPVKPGDELKLIVKYKADEPGHFSKSIKVFCNTKDSPISLKITGEALAN